MDTEFSKKKALVFGALLLVFLAIPVTIYTALQVQETRTRAEKATILTLSPTSQTAQASDQVDLDVSINPGINQVDYVKMVINFDPAIFDSASTTFTLDPATKFKLTTTSITSNGQIIVTLDVGSNPTDTVRSAQKIGTLNLFTQDENLPAGETQVIFNEALTDIRSIGETDTFHENVLSSTTPAVVIIEAAPSATPVPTQVPSITPSISPSVSPTPPVCEVPDQVQNIRINCPNCDNLSPTLTPTPTEEPTEEQTG